MLGAWEEDRGRRGRVGAQGRGRVSPVLHGHQHQLRQVLLTGLHVYGQTRRGFRRFPTAGPS